MTAASASVGAVKTRDVLAMIPPRAAIANTPTDQTLVLNVDLKFVENSVDIEPDNIPMLDSLATLLIQRRDLALEILNEGNLKNADQDAITKLQLKTQAIRELLIRRGVPPSRIQSYAGKAAMANPSYRFSEAGKTTFVFTKM